MPLGRSCPVTTALAPTTPDDDLGAGELVDPEEVAAQAGLRYVTDREPGISRRRCGRGFSYRHSSGRLISAVDKKRIGGLAVPPAWHQVWICGDASGHLQATGRDDRGRKQYRYHPTWRQVRDGHKFESLSSFGAALPRLRSAVDHDLDLPGLPRERVLAVVVKLLDETLVRVGNAEYANDNETFGLTTLRDDHVKFARRSMHLQFVGKSGVDHDVQVDDERLARIARRCHELGGRELFTYRDESGDARLITSADVNSYLRERSGLPITAKDFRTWGGSVIALEALVEALGAEEATTDGSDDPILWAVDAAAEVLRNSRPVCRASYIHPAVLSEAGGEAVLQAWHSARSRRFLRRPEVALLHLLASSSGT